MNTPGLIRDKSTDNIPGKRCKSITPGRKSNQITAQICKRLIHKLPNSCQPTHPFLKCNLRTCPLSLFVPIQLNITNSEASLHLNIPEDCHTRSVIVDPSVVVWLFGLAPAREGLDVFVLVSCNWCLAFRTESYRQPTKQSL